MIQFVGRIGYVVVILLALVGITSVAGRFVGTVAYLADPAAVDVAHRRKPLHLQDMIPNQPPGGAAEQASGRPPENFDRRYYEHPYLTLVHITTGFVFMVLGPIQFWPAVRNRWIGYHRVAGRVWMMASLVSVIAALIMVPTLPVFGSFEAGVAVTMAGSAFLACLVQGYRRIRKRQITQHREWMIRTFAIGLGISTFRVLLPVLMAFGATFPEAWDTAAWLGFLVNAVVAEVWIKVTRRQPQSTAIRGPSRERVLQPS